MSVLLILGLIMGIRHTLKPDHVAAVLALSAQSGSLSATAKQGAIWGGWAHNNAIYIQHNAFRLAY